MLFEAIFEPSEQMQYNSNAKTLAGKKIAVQDGWVIKDGVYKGQQCFYIPNSTIGWIPRCDLKKLTPVPFVRWKETLKKTGFGN